MTRFVVPRRPRFAMALAVIASMALSIGSYSTAFGQAVGDDEPIYACLFAGALSQVSTTPPTNCGRGTVVTWPSYADFVAMQEQLDTDVADLQDQLDQEIANRGAGDQALQDLIDALTQRVSDLEAENEQQQQEIDDLKDALTQAIADLEAAIQDVADDLAEETTNRQNADTTLQSNLNTEITNRTNADANLQDQIDDLQDQIDNNVTIMGSLWDAINGIVGNDFGTVVTILKDVAGDVGKVAETVINQISNFFQTVSNFMSNIFTSIEDWFCSSALGFLCGD